MLNITKHELTMKKILSDIYSDPSLRSSLGFKGGTCLYFFYGLDRFSTDLDFNILADKIDILKITEILSQYLTIEDQPDKYATHFWLGSYEKNKQKVKVEISKRDYPDTYEVKDFYGLSVATMTKDCMFAHKLCAITDRKVLQNRDLYDTWFMFRQDFEINEAIILLKTGKTTKEYLKYLVEFIETKVDKRNILNGLGEVLNESQKSWVKNSLVQKLLFELKIRSE